MNTSDSTDSLSSLVQPAPEDTRHVEMLKSRLFSLLRAKDELSQQLIHRQLFNCDNNNDEVTITKLCEYIQDIRRDIKSVLLELRHQ